MEVNERIQVLALYFTIVHARGNVSELKRIAKGTFSTSLVRRQRICKVVKCGKSAFFHFHRASRDLREINLAHLIK